MTRALSNRLSRLEAAALAGQPVAPVPVFIPTHLAGTAEALAEQAAWQRLHPGRAVIVRVVDGSKPLHDEQSGSRRT